MEQIDMDKQQKRRAKRKIRPKVDPEIFYLEDELARLDIVSPEDNKFLKQSDFNRLYSSLVKESIARSEELNLMHNELIQLLTEYGYTVRIQGFGVFELKERKGHVGRNFHSTDGDSNAPKKMVLAPFRAFTFSPSRTYKTRIREQDEQGIVRTTLKKAPRAKPKRPRSKRANFS